MEKGPVEKWVPTRMLVVRLLVSARNHSLSRNEISTRQREPHSPAIDDTSSLHLVPSRPSVPSLHRNKQIGTLCRALNALRISCSRPPGAALSSYTHLTRLTFMTHQQSSSSQRDIEPPINARVGDHLLLARRYLATRRER